MIDPSEYGKQLAADRKAKRRPAYFDTRGTGSIEAELRMEGMNFSFEQQLTLLASKFPGETLEVLDSGCGEGNALRGIRGIARTLGIPINTTGITLDRKHAASLESIDVDTVLIGPIELHQQRGSLESRQFHFLLDFCGPALYSPDSLLLYPDLVRPDGNALISMGDAVFKISMQNLLKSLIMDMKGLKEEAHTYSRHVSLFRKRRPDEEHLRLESTPLKGLTSFRGIPERPIPIHRRYPLS